MSWKIRGTYGRTFDSFTYTILLFTLKFDQDVVANVNQNSPNRGVFLLNGDKMEFDESSTIVYNTGCYEVVTTKEFKRWLQKLKDRVGSIAIVGRLKRFEKGNFSDCKSLGGGLFEARIHSGPGYRIYFATEDRTLVIILAGGKKATQRNDIAKALQLLTERKVYK